MDMSNEFDEDELRTIQSLATFLNEKLLGFTPQGSVDAASMPSTPDVDQELFQRNNILIAEFVILAALLLMEQEARDTILAAVKPSRFQQRSFTRYLFEEMRRTYSEAGTIEVLAIQRAIPDFEPRMYGEASSPRTLFGTHYNWAMILKLRPTWRQVVRAIEILNKSVE